MYEIFAELLEKKGLKAADVTRATGIKSPVFSEWKKGKSKLKKYQLWTTDPTRNRNLQNRWKWL